MLSSSVVCLPFTILNTFETKKGIIKILVYSSVITVTVKPVLSGHPLSSGHLSKSWKSLPLFTVNLTSIKLSPLLSGRSHPFKGPKVLILLFLTVLNGHFVYKK